MANQLSGPRKRRTRQHVISDLSVHHLEGFILRAGHTAHRLSPDYGYDLVMFTYGPQGFLEPGSIYIQVKATDALQAVGTDYVFELDIHDYNLWRLEQMPVILIQFDAVRERAYWIGVQNYFRSDQTRQPKQGAKHVRIRFPNRQWINRGTVVKWRALKSDVRNRATGEL